jgi:hypothetical protein
MKIDGGNNFSTKSDEAYTSTVNNDDDGGGAAKNSKVQGSKYFQGRIAFLRSNYSLIFAVNQSKHTGVLFAANLYDHTSRSYHCHQ